MTASIQPTAQGIKRAAGSVSKRKLATKLSRQLHRRVLAASVGKKMSHEQYLAKMLVELATNMETTTMDGKVVKVTDIKEWSEIVKFIHTHLDGPASSEAQFNGLNVFKVYAGIDVDKV